MDGTREAGGELGNTGYELFIGALSMLSLINVVLFVALRNDDIRQVVLVMDGLLSVIFLLDFLMRLHRAPSRSAYLVRGHGWADLLASLPFPQFKLLRIFRLVRVARLMRNYGIHAIGRSLRSDRAGSALLTLLLLGILVLEFGSLLMLAQEQGVDGANITTASDALWYVLVTMSTVGYGDQFPVGHTGRVLGALIIVVGVGIFGTLTGYLANLFVRPDDAAAPADAAPAAASDDVLGSDVRELARRSRQLAAEQQEVIDRLEALLDAPGRAR
jgi:voltage-gated potassium channel